MKQLRRIDELADRIVQSMQARQESEKTVKQVYANHRGVNAERAREAIELLVLTQRAAWKDLPPDGLATGNTTFILTDPFFTKRCTKLFALSERNVDRLIRVVHDTLERMKPDLWERPCGYRRGEFDATHELFIALTQGRDVAPKNDQWMAKLVQEMRRHELTSLYVGDIYRYAYDIPKSDVLRMLDLYVVEGLGRWPYGRPSGPDISPDVAVFELVD